MVQRVVVFAFLVAVAGVSVAAEPITGAAYGPWVVGEHRDRMTDKVQYGLLCAAVTESAIMAIPNPAAPPFLTVLAHDFPGKTMRARVDKNQALEIGEGMKPATHDLIEQMLTGQTLLVEYYNWPHDAARYAECSLAGFRQGWRAIGGAVTLTAEEVAADAATAENLRRSVQRVGGVDRADFVVATGELLQDAVMLENAVREFCNAQHRGGLCEVRAWSSAERAPSGSLPPSDAHLRAQIAHYERNAARGRDCFFLLRDGEEVTMSHSSGCAPPP